MSKHPIRVSWRVKSRNDKGQTVQDLIQGAAESIKTNTEGLRAAQSVRPVWFKLKFDRLDLALVVWFILSAIANMHTPEPLQGAVSGVLTLLAFLDRSLRLILRELRR